MKNLSFLFFIGTLIFAPLAFGTAEEWSMAAVQMLVALAVFFFYLQRRNSSEKLLNVPGLIPLVLLVGFMLLQIVPLPAVLVRILAPSTYQVYQPILEQTGGSDWLPLTVYRKETVREALRFAGYGFFYVLTVQLLASGERLKKTVFICVWLAIGIAVVAILQKYSSPDKIYWLRSVAENAAPVGPWVNRSQYCGFMEIMAPLVLGLTLFYRPSLSPEESLRQRVVSFFSMAGGNLYIVLGFGLLVMVCSVFISLSRGGIIAVTVALLVFFALLAWKNTRYSSLFFIGTIGCLVGSVAWFGWDPIVGRFEQIIGRSGELNIDRFRIWDDIYPLIRDFWLTGSGFGTFIAIFPTYRTFPGREIYDHAHNDYLELLSDGGIIGFALAAWFTIAVLRAGWKMIARRRDRYAQLMSIGAFSGIVAMLIHGLSDFNMHNGAVGLYFFFLCGLLVSVGHTRFYYKMDSTLLARSRNLSKGLFLFSGGIFFCMVLLVQGGAILARLKYDGIRQVYLNRQLSKDLLLRVSSALRQSGKADPFEGIYSSLQGDVQRYLRQSDKSLAAYLEAAAKDPLNGAYLQQIGMMLPAERRALAEALIERGAKVTLHKDDLLLARAEWLLESGQRTKAIAAVRQGLDQNPKLVKTMIPLLQGFSFSREELAAVLPESVEVWLQAGAFLEKLEDSENGVFFREHALDFMNSELTVKADWFAQLYHFYRARKEEDKALAILRQGIAKVPNYPRFHEWLGDWYVRDGITYRAEEEYQQALLLEPENVSIHKKLEKLNGR